MIPNPNIVKGIDLPDEHVYTSKVMMQAFATEVFRLLARNGSIQHLLVVLKNTSLYMGDSTTAGIVLQYITLHQQHDQTNM